MGSMKYIIWTKFILIFTCMKDKIALNKVSSVVILESDENNNDLYQFEQQKNINIRNLIGSLKTLSGAAFCLTIICIL